MYKCESRDEKWKKWTPSSTRSAKICTFLIENCYFLWKAGDVRRSPKTRNVRSLTGSPGFPVVISRCSFFFAHLMWRLVTSLSLKIQITSSIYGNCSLSGSLWPWRQLRQCLAIWDFSFNQNRLAIGTNADREILSDCQYQPNERIRPNYNALLPLSRSKRQPLASCSEEDAGISHTSGSDSDQIILSLTVGTTVENIEIYFLHSKN